MEKEKIKLHISSILCIWWWNEYMLSLAPRSVFLTFSSIIKMYCVTNNAPPMHPHLQKEYTNAKEIDCLTYLLKNYNYRFFFSFILQVQILSFFGVQESVTIYQMSMVSRGCVCRRKKIANNISHLTFDRVY